MNEALIVKFNRNGGYLPNTGKLSRSEKYQLHLAFKEGKVMRIKQGLYRLNEFPVSTQEAEISQIVPVGIFCMYTAWAYYELTTFISSEYHIAVPKSFKITIPDYPPVKIYFWSKTFFEKGLSEKEIGDSQVRMYDLERSVCDAVRFRNKIGTDMLGEILRNYMKRKDKNIDKLLKYASLLRISNVLNQFIQVMI